MRVLKRRPGLGSAMVAGVAGCLALALGLAAAASRRTQNTRRALLLDPGATEWNQQSPVFSGGNAYLDREFPRLDRIARATIVIGPRAVGRSRERRENPRNGSTHRKPPE